MSSPASRRASCSPLYCLVGEERFLIDRCLEALRAAVFGPAGAGADFNLDHFDLKERSLAAVLDSARTLPMFAKRRLVIARGLDELKSDDLEPLADYLADPNPSTCLALVGGAKIDGRLKLFQAVQEGGLPARVPPPARLAAGRVAAGRGPPPQAHPGPRGGPAAGRGGRARPGPGGHVPGAGGAVRRAGRPHRAAITSQAVVPESRERGIFELTKAIGAGQRAQALRLLGNLLRNREPALRIQFMLMRQLRQIWRAKELQAAGAPRSEIAGRVGMSPHFLDDVLVPARKMSTGALVRSFDLLYKADQSLKSSRVDPDIQITRLVTALTEAAAASTPR